MNNLTLFLVLSFLVGEVVASTLPSSERSEAATKSVKSRLVSELTAQNLEYGAPIFIRIFKGSSTLELWMESNDGKFKLFKEYEICAYSGDLGPKEQEGDLQSPEGFYFVNAGRLNPWSQFHLSFNLGYPNKYDRMQGRTGSALMVHGDCVSIGCYAMTDTNINEIYTLATEALKGGQPFFRVHAFPFKLTDENLDKYRDHRWYEFWRNLQGGYKYFLVHGRPPNVEVEQGKYVFGV
ncbi:hypothetical protein Misp06_02847 [Microbulbifer sp. NBRC 101763]